MSIDLQKQIESYKNFVVLVEGKKDAAALRLFGFERVYEIHRIGFSERESVEKIAEKIGRKESVCVLTDFDDKGEKLNSLARKILQEHGIKVEGSLRKILKSEGISHVEGLGKFMNI